MHKRVYPVFAYVFWSRAFVLVSRSVPTEITPVRKDKGSSSLVGLLWGCTEMSRTQHPRKQSLCCCRGAPRSEDACHQY